MFEITTMRIWIGISLAWPMLWVVVFDRWFFFSPLGLVIALGIPIAGWLLWWKYYERDGQKLMSEGRLVLGRSAETLLKVKKQLSKKHISSK